MHIDAEEGKSKSVTEYWQNEPEVEMDGVADPNATIYIKSWTQTKSRKNGTAPFAKRPAHLGGQQIKENL